MGKEHILIEEGRLTCEKECSFVSCCFTNDDNSPFSCKQTSKDMCNKYKDICNILQTFNFVDGISSTSATTLTNMYDDIRIIRYAPFNIHELCSDENVYYSYTGKEICEKVCAPSDCCWDNDDDDNGDNNKHNVELGDGIVIDTSTGSNNCIENNKEACDTYSV